MKGKLMGLLEGSELVVGGDIVGDKGFFLFVFFETQLWVDWLHSYILVGVGRRCRSFGSQLQSCDSGSLGFLRFKERWNVFWFNGAPRSWIPLRLEA